MHLQLTINRDAYPTNRSGFSLVETSAWHGIVNVRAKAGTEQNEPHTKAPRHEVKTENKKRICVETMGSTTKCTKDTKWKSLCCHTA